ncbi:DUF2316 family protein [Lacticaseibacillus mingshuiensis]|nr:DUF2316 family protein [Lacticaseibacillus mingshuiensis]
MSLTPEQKAATKHELAENFAKTGLTQAQVCADLRISAAKFDHIMTLTQTSLEDPWIMRNYLLEKVAAAGQTPLPFTALSGDWHRHWFLNSAAIDARQMSAGDR